MSDHISVRRRPILRLLLDAAEHGDPAPTITIETLLTTLGDKSFGWSILFFAVVNLIPMPLGTTLITAIPLILLTAQMALGYDHVHLPDFINRHQLPRAGLRRVIIRLRPWVRPIERIIQPRMTWLFYPRLERIIGGFLCMVSIALFIPLPLSGWIPAFALFITAFGLIERDGVVSSIGLGAGAIGLMVTAAVIMTLATHTSGWFQKLI